jgi:hypothetical protein
MKGSEKNVKHGVGLSVGLGVSWIWFFVGVVLSIVLLLTFTVFTVKEGVMIRYPSSVVISELKPNKPVNKNFIEWVIMDKYPVLPQIKQRYDRISRRSIVKEFVNNSVQNEIILPAPEIPEVLKPKLVELDILDQQDLDEMDIEEKTEKMNNTDNIQEDTENNLLSQETPMSEPVLLTHAILQQMSSVPSDLKVMFHTEKNEPIRPKRKGENGPISELIELILYINEPEHRNQKVKIEQEIKRIFNRDDRIDTFCVKAEKREDGSIGKLLSHITALSVACEQQRNVMILEDDFEFYKSRDDIQEHLKLIQSSFDDRWNVIVLGQYTYEWSPVSESIDETIKLMRLLQCSSTCGYIVNRTYLPVLLNIWIEHMYNVLGNPDNVHHEHLDQVQTRLQSQDIWLGFESPIGGHGTHVKEGIIENEEISDLSNVVKSREKWTIQDIGIYIKTSNRTQRELNELLRHIYLDTHKGHRLHVAVHHKENQKFVNKHRRSYSSTFYSGVQYFSSEQQVQEYLKPYSIVQWIDLEKWTKKEDLEKLFKLVSQPVENNVLKNYVSDSDSHSTMSGSDSGSESGYIPCLSSEQRKHFLQGLDLEEMTTVC